MIPDRDNLVLIFYKNGRNVDYSYIRTFDLKIVVYNLKQFANIFTYDLLLYTILAIESILYMCLRYGKGVKSTSGLTRHINVCKIPISLPCCQLSNPDLVLDYNTTNPLDLPLDHNQKGITPEVSNHGDLEGIRLANIGNNKKDIRSADIDKLSK